MLKRPGLLGTALVVGFVMMLTGSAAVRLVGDFTGDGKRDIIALNATNKPIFSLYVNTTLA